MIKIERSNLRMDDVFTNCVDNYRGEISTDFNEGLRTSMKEEEEEYISLAQNKSLHILTPPPSSENKVRKLDLLKIYSNKLKNTKINDTISELSFNKCPICLLSIPGTLDHLLPKEIFYNFSLTPANLVPMCDSCNRKKGKIYGISYVKSPFHPYFDAIDYHENINITIAINLRSIEVSINLVKNDLDDDLYDKLHFNFYDLYKVDEPFKSDFLGALRNILNGWKRNDTIPEKKDIEETLVKKKRRAYEDYSDEKTQGGLFFLKNYAFLLFYDELLQRIDRFYDYLVDNKLVIKFE